MKELEEQVKEFQLTWRGIDRLVDTGELNPGNLSEDERETLDEAREETKALVDRLLQNHLERGQVLSREEYPERSAQLEKQLGTEVKYEEAVRWQLYNELLGVDSDRYYGEILGEKYGIEVTQ